MSIVLGIQLGFFSANLVHTDMITEFSTVLQWITYPPSSLPDFALGHCSQ